MAKPSAMAVLPTPGSPTKMGLFLVLLDKMCSVLLISSSLPITGSSFPSLAISIKFLAYLFSALNCVSEVWEETVEPFFKSLMAAIKPFSFKPASFNNLEVLSLPCNMASNKCSTLTNSSLKVFKVAVARNKTLLASRPKDCAGSPLEIFGSFSIAVSSFSST